MKRIFPLLALLPIGAYAFEFNVTIVWKSDKSKGVDFLASQMDGKGNVAGTYYSSVQNDSERAAVWTNGVIRTFEGLGSSSFANAINDRGQVAGGAKKLTSDNQVAAYWDSDGTFKNIGRGSFSQSLAITEQGTILGYDGLAFLWKGGNHIDLPKFDYRNTSYPIDINDSEVAVGYDFLPEGGGSRPWMWDAANGLQQIPVIPYAINDFGVVAGTRYVWDNNYAFAYENGVMRQLEGGSTAYAVNNELLFVGENFFSEGVLWHGYRDAESLTDLIDRSLGLKIERAFDVNDAGQILAYAVSLDGKQAYTVRLDPVPEPASILALGAGGLWMALRRRGRPCKGKIAEAE